MRESGGGDDDRVLKANLRQHLANAFLCQLLGVECRGRSAENDPFGQDLNGQVPDTAVSSLKNRVVDMQREIFQVTHVQDLQDCLFPRLLVKQASCSHS